MKTLLYMVAFVCAASIHVSAQNLENNVNVLFMKAQVLYDQERYDESVRMYNQILKEDDEFAPALLMRAKSKYQLGAHKGTKEDVLEFIRLQGVTKEVIKLMSQTEQQLGNVKAATNYANTAIELDPYDSELYLIMGYLHFTQKNKSEACEQWQKSSELGDRRATALMKEHCALITEMKEMQRKEKEMAAAKKKKDRENKKAAEKETEEDSEDKIEKSKEDADTIVLADGDSKQEEKERSPIFDDPDPDAIQEVEIDEELSVVIGNGLGNRKLDSNPDMFIISNTKGKVVIDICVNGKGKVESSAINKKLTTLFKTSLTSLALRKSKEFVFYPSFRDEQCGYLIFAIDPQE